MQRLLLLKRIQPRTIVRYYTNERTNNNNNLGKKAAEDALMKSKAYLEQLQAEIRPRLSPVLLKVQTASDTLKRLTQDVNDPKEALRRASRVLNELTGYNHIEAVKHKVNEQAQMFEATRGMVQEAKVSYEDAIDTRSSTQRGINELLQRKHLWTGEDVTRFTELYRLEHEHSRAETVAKEHYQQCEKKMDREYMELARSIMERYHEEQLWSDKIRSVSTYGTWALMGLNLLLFVAVQTIFEPRKRKRLTDRFEELLVSKVDEEEEKIAEMLAHLEQKYIAQAEQQQEAMVATLIELVAQPTLAAAALPAEQVVVQDEISPPPVLIEDDEVAPEIIMAEPTPQDPSMLTMSKNSLVLYSLESAVAGGLVAALAMFFWK
ncbi:sensitivity to high expression protein she9 [Apophysomyces sp. BC1015]|nr:sensitivity to high expression protein she9 [Apophysomyces sp. BC1015]KAG0176188.1 sensitivity to high expression protein she9 [Apophysomyces sp. BC1021]